MSGNIFPDTLTPSQNIQQAWGKLVSCLSTLESTVLYKPSVKIGREKLCDVVVDRNKILSNDTNISKEHCVLTKEPDDENVYITDLSKNGTFLNGVRIGRNNRKNLKDNDKIALVKDADVFIFQMISKGDLPDTVTSESSLELSLPMTVKVPIWGRLVSCLMHLDCFDMYKPVFKVGRSSQCDAVIDAMNIVPNIKMRFSKEHFVIFNDPDISITVIKDLSKTGTYLNGTLIGKNNTNILQHDDTISIGPKRTRIYVYKSMSPSDINYLPPELRQKYEISNLLGKGACGEVRLAYKKRTCKMYAIKRILKGRSTTSQMYKINHPSKIENEVKILKSLSHPFIIDMKEIVETEDQVFLVLEYMPGGELNNRILSNQPQTESNIKFLFYQMVQAVQFLHMKGITHRDLKPENVLLSSNDIETIIKVSDFGLSKITEEDDMMHTVCGTMKYIAPEVLDARIPEYDKQVDVWSLGVILFYMLSKELPFNSSEKSALAQFIISGNYNMDNMSWNGISFLAKDLVNKMLKVNPQERITISGILSHQWLAKDIAMHYRLKTLLENKGTPDSTDDLEDSIDPPSKRIRLSGSDESA